jgi:hypothetical protein
MDITQPVKVVGCHYHAGVGDVHPGMDLVLVREPSNPHDRNAVRVQTLSGTSLGHLSRDDAMLLAPIIDGGAVVKAFVISVSHKPARFDAHVLFDERWLHSPRISSLKSPSAAKPSGGCLPVCICMAIIIGIVCFILHSK